MIIVILLLFVVLTFLAWIYIKPITLRVLAGSLALLGMALSVLAITLNFTNQLGMKEVTTVKEQKIYTAGDTKSPANMLIAKEVGDDSNNYVMVYRNHADDKKAKVHNKPDSKHITEAIKKTGTYHTKQTDHATVKTTTTRLRFKNDFYKMMFGISEQQNKLVKQRTVVTVPSKTWVVLTPEQAKQLGAKQKQMSPKMQQMQQAQMKQAVTQKMTAYMQAHPDATAAQQKAQTKAISSEMATTAVKQQLSELK
ncbi:hypothetical protein JOC36_000671 [Weissella uvarum]|uniref:DUF4811 domain-containing protein n=1 Tax=Weissella uvarum TaxID=1479233 RepID=UPI001961BE6A|nr:DUF4811 domain-containing protein [Weissella uvarum]MBM7617122.1 hypothetical protein [Weissella uvarum]MCM0595418.1 DUF4811 domain-containing protein [Weissella uvarum]